MHVFSFPVSLFLPLPKLTVRFLCPLNSNKQTNSLKKKRRKPKQNQLMFLECQRALTLSHQQEKQITLSEAFHWQLQGTHSHSLNLETLNANAVVASKGCHGTSPKSCTSDFDFVASDTLCDLKLSSCCFKCCFQTCVSRWASLLPTCKWS